MTKYPLFPLGSIVFPNGLLSLRIFETRYIDMVRAAMRDQMPFVITAYKKRDDEQQAREVQDIGTTANIIDFEQLPDGLLGITVLGHEKVSISDIDAQADGLLLGHLQSLPSEASAAMPEDFALLIDVLKKMLPEIQSHYGESLAPYLKENYADATWVSARLVEWLPINTDMKIELLRLEDSQERVRIIYEVLQRMQII